MPSFEEALSKAEYETPHGQTFVLGGSRVYGDALKKINCTQVFMTKISKSPNIGVCDVYFPRENVDDFGSVENITRSIYQLDPEKFIKGGALLDDENLRVDQTSDMISYQILHLYRKR